MQGIVKSLMVSIWFMLLTFPLVGIRIDSLTKSVIWRFDDLLLIGVGSFVLSFVWRYLMMRKELGAGAPPLLPQAVGQSIDALKAQFENNASTRNTALALVVVGLCALPWLVSTYQTNIMISALLYIMLGLGLNIVVGLAGQLVLGYIAFYAMGAYVYALLNANFDLGFWDSLAFGGAMAAFLALFLVFLLRLKGDYLAIVTLGFGEIVRLVLEKLERRYTWR